MKKHSLIHYEPPFENNFQERIDTISEHYVPQRLDNFNHQNKQTFRMVNKSNLYMEI